MNDKKYKQIMSATGSHPWTDKELINLTRLVAGLFLLAMVMIALPIVVVYQLVKIIL